MVFEIQYFHICDSEDKLQPSTEASIPIIPLFQIECSPGPMHILLDLPYYGQPSGREV